MNIFYIYPRDYTLGIMRAQLRAPLKPLGTPQHSRIGGFKGALNWAPISREMPVSRTTNVYFELIIYRIKYSGRIFFVYAKIYK